MGSRRVTDPGPSDRYQARSFSRDRRQQVDWLHLARRGRSIHFLFEADVTDARRAIRQYRAHTGASLSFTAYAAWCLGRAIDDDRRIQGYRRGRRLIVFDDVDATMFVASSSEDAVPTPHVVRALNRLTPSEIERALRLAQVSARSPRVRPALALWLLVPGFVRRLVWSILLADPRRRKSLTGTVAVTAVGMYARGAAWAIPITTYTLCMTIGGFDRRPGIVGRGDGERIEPREYVSITLTFDHDVVDGAPAMQFAARLRERLERAALPVPAAAPADAADADGEVRTRRG